MRLSSKSQLAHLQQGAALIAVLIILVIITLLGVTAMRMGITSLALATNSQVVQLLFQSADMGTKQVIASIGVGATATASLDTNGVVAGKSGTLCFTPIATAKFTNLSSGNCNANDADSYLSKRKVVLTQINYTREDTNNIQANDSEVDLSSTGQSENLTGAQETLKVFSTAVVPSFGSATPDTINSCLNKDADDAKDKTIVTITDCLTNAGVVFTTHASEYQIKRDF